MRVLLTGAAGFIGSELALRLLARGDQVLGVDDLNPYYSPALKQARLARIEAQGGDFRFEAMDIAEAERLKALTASFAPEIIVHLAAQAGVRYSLENPFAYARANLDGQLSVLEAARAAPPRHLVYASSSSVYGGNDKTPFSEDDRTDAPVSLYGATKKSGEALATSYARLYNLPMTGLRFFTVYGPWGRPDMAYWIFADKMSRGEPIRVFNNGRMGRDFTYVDGIVDGITGVMALPPTADEHHLRILNLGNDRPEELMALVRLVERGLGTKAQIVFEGMQKGDVERTWADISKARSLIGYDPKVTLEEGIGRFVAWWRDEKERALPLAG
jgi:UDP-glucuronate 4-epimerase